MGCDWNLKLIICMGCFSVSFVALWPSVSKKGNRQKRKVKRELVESREQPRQAGGKRQEAEGNSN
jgi:hypothetical protein